MNRHTAAGSYKPFVDVIANDGYVVQANKSKFSKDILKKHNILVISNAKAPITAEESDAIHTWVKEGGSLFLIADHNPYGDGKAAQRIVQAILHHFHRGDRPADFIPPGA